MTGELLAAPFPAVREAMIDGVVGLDQMLTITDPHAEPGTDDPVAPPDERTRSQRQHDALAATLGVAASSGLLPTIGGHTPTVVVAVDADDLERGTGYAHVQGCDQPISVDWARHIASAGVIQRVTMSRHGRIFGWSHPLNSPRRRSDCRAVTAYCLVSVQ